MRSYRELTGKYLLNQKKRTILAIIGIILSTALISSAGIMGESLQNMMFQNIKESYGNYHTFYAGIEESKLKLFENNIKVEESGYIIPTATYKPAKGQSVLITACDSNAMNMLYIELSSGKLPQKQDEIVLEQWIVDNMKNKPAIGDKISMEINVITNQIAATEDKLSNRKVTYNFILSGILKSKSSSQLGGGCMGLISSATAKKILNYPDIKYMAVVRFKDNIPAQKAIKETAAAAGVKDKDIYQNSAVLALEGQSNRQSANTSILIVEIIMISVIILTTIAVIYNVFHISVIERIHQFGILRSIGSTPSQIRIIVLREALTLCLIGLPLGIICGILAVKSVVGIFSMISGNSLFGGMNVIISLRIIAMSAAVGLATILISSYGPAVMAGSVSPLEAILNNGKISKDKIKRRKHPILKKFFGIEGVMAYENLKRNRKRFFITVFSMCIGISLFVFFSSFMKFTISQTAGNFSKDFAIDKPLSNTGYTMGDYEDMANIRGVKMVYRTMLQNITTLLTSNQSTNSFNSYVKSMGKKYCLQYNGKSFNSFEAEIYGLRTNELQICKGEIYAGSISPEKMDEENGVIVYQKMELNKNKMKVSDLKIGDEIQVIIGEKAVKLKVMGLLNKMPMDSNAWVERFKIITTENVFKSVTGNNTFSRFDIELEKGANKASVKQQLQSIQKRIGESRFLDFSEVSDRVWAIQMSIILYGLVFVISIIGALNIINTISTNLILRTREFGTLRAIGMTPGQMRKMINLEGIFYGGIATFFGGAAGLILSRLIYIYLNKLKELPWTFPWGALIIGSISAILIGLLSTMIPLKKISRMDVVEAVRALE